MRGAMLPVELLIIVTLFPILGVATPDDDPPVALPGCENHCGDLKIPYPFGVGLNCSHNSWFQIDCDRNVNGPPIPYLTKLVWSGITIKHEAFTPPPPPIYFKPKGSKVMNISLGSPESTSSSLRRSLLTSGSFGNLPVSGEKLHAYKTLNMTQTPYLVMGERNALLVGGCSGGEVLVMGANKTVAGCATVCVNETALSNGTVGDCYGLGCCQSFLPTSLDFVQVVFLNLVDRSNTTSVDTQVSAALVDISYLVNRTVDRTLSEFREAPTMLQWRLEDLPVDLPAYANSSCVKESDGGYGCTCKRDYYHGNPYLPNGCLAIKECGQCPDDCFPIDNGTFRCPLPPPTLSPLPLLSNRKTMVLALGLGISLASVFMLIIVFGFYQLLKKRKEVSDKKNNFKRNGGLLLKQQMRSGDHRFVERTKVFTSCELEKATDSFNQNRVLGRGGQGTVYKGMLTDGAIVAIKKSKKVSEKQLEQFINEVVILSQVNHRNVVKLFGCCMETSVPLLVYEYVPNGTLYHHIHNSSEDFCITWKMRMLIATESAEALAYLHSWSSSPIYHRDIKTSNILLDGKYKAKISDFGTSKTLSIDQTHVTTCVQGTFGYIDPEFLQSNQFTEKSDVYSFGIVLLELLTSKKPVYLDISEEPRSLVSDFLAAMRSCNLHDVVDPKNIKEAGEKEIEHFADLARRCLNLSRDERPTMKEVAMALQMIVSSENREPDAFQQDSMTRNEIIADQIYTSTEDNSFSLSSSYGAR